MLKEFLEARRERIQNLINKGFNVEIKFSNSEFVALGSKVTIYISYDSPRFSKFGTYWVKDNDDKDFTEAIEAAEKLDLNMQIVEDFVNSLSK